MESVLQALFTWQFILFCLLVSGITLVIRRVVEYFLANSKVIAKESKLWRDLLLPILPIFVGVIFALIAKKYPYPVEILSASGRAAWGLSGGLLSGLSYRVVSSFVTAFIVSKIPTAVVNDPNLAPDPVVNVVTVIPDPSTLVTVPVPTVSTPTTTIEK